MTMTTTDETIITCTTIPEASETTPTTYVNTMIATEIENMMSHVQLDTMR